MSLLDKAGLEAIQELNKVTLPKIQALVESTLIRSDKILDEDWAKIVKDAHALLDRLNGATITISIPERKTT